MPPCTSTGSRQGVPGRRPRPRLRWCGCGCAGVRWSSRTSGAGRAAGTGPAKTPGSPHGVTGARRLRCGNARPGSLRSSRSAPRCRGARDQRECSERDRMGAPGFSGEARTVPAAAASARPPTVTGATTSARADREQRHERACATRAPDSPPRSTESGRGPVPPGDGCGSSGLHAPCGVVPPRAARYLTEGHQGPLRGPLGRRLRPRATAVAAGPGRSGPHRHRHPHACSVRVPARRNPSPGFTATDAGSSVPVRPLRTDTVRSLDGVRRPGATRPAPPP